MQTRQDSMELPIEIALNLKKYEVYQNDIELLAALQKEPEELLSFLFYASEDETWAEEHSSVMKGILIWLTDANMHQNFPYDFFQPVISPLKKHMSILKPFIPLDLKIYAEGSEYFMNSLLLSNQSSYFLRRINNECRGKKNPALKVDISLSVLQLIEEFAATGEIKDLWKKQPDELWELIDSVTPLGFPLMVEACEEILRRYMDRTNVFEMLIHAHRKKLQLLQNACIEYINNLDLGVRLLITPVEHLSLAFLDYKERAHEVFESLSPYITQLVFSNETAGDANFKIVVSRCPRLMGVDLSDSTTASDYLGDLPDGIKELHLSHCRWLNNACMQTLAIACPNITTLDLSSNDQLTYAIWSELQKFKKIKSLDISRCFQVGDHELRMIVQACPQLTELKILECQKITDTGFFEVGRGLPKLSFLNLSRTLISDPALIELMTRCKNLYALDLSRCHGISDKGVLEGIRNCPSLKIININNAGLSESGVELIKKNNPYLQLL
jgi:F-box and leucine-rich repeat protein 2/20